MRRLCLLLFGLLVLLSATACNKERPRKLDYAAKEKAGLYTGTGLPGEGFVGQPSSATKFTEKKKTTPEAEKPPADKKKETK
ncbi:MAG TPA: hypothetical protein VM425_02410 [Myxococcota bacterium]|nr:hypothetical protein [Myxococcota bacterium]